MEETQTMCHYCDNGVATVVETREEDDGVIEVLLWECGSCETRFESKRSKQIYLNIYEVQRCAGGPEEGGWYFDAGIPIESICVPGITAGNRLRERLLKGRYAPEPGHRDRNSVIGGPDVEIYFEDHFATPFPERRPHYE